MLNPITFSQPCSDDIKPLATVILVPQNTAISPGHPIASVLVIVFQAPLSFCIPSIIMQFLTSLILLAAVINGALHTVTVYAIPYTSTESRYTTHSSKPGLERQSTGTDTGNFLIPHVINLTTHMARFKLPWRRLQQSTTVQVGKPVKSINFVKTLPSDEYYHIYMSVIHKSAEEYDGLDEEGKRMWDAINYWKSQFPENTRWGKILRAGNVVLRPG
ncbi:hypothetical protein BC835DRAFT_1422949 [Cytidiella melzeri]|nr:hypothetical protein BC835DRAFT_1422949 [Cytidiella melzeri]